MRVSDTGYHLIRMKITQSGNHTISVSQFDKRCAPPEADHEYTNCKIVVVKTAKGTFESGVTFVKGDKGFVDRDAYVELESISPGIYYICVEMELHTNPNWMQFGSVMSVTNYGPGETTFLGDDSQIYPVSQFLEAAYESKINKFPDSVTKTTMEANDAKDIEIYEQSETPEGYRFIQIKNNNKNFIFVEDMNFRQFEGQQILTPHIGSNDAEDVLTITDKSYKFHVAPGHQKMVIIRCDVRGYGMSGSKKRQLIPYEE